VGVEQRDRGGEVRWTHELRLKDRSGVSRVIYALITRGTVLVIHAFKKTTQHLGADANTTEGGSVMKRMRRSSPARLARQLSIPKSRGLEAVLKAQLIEAIVREISRRGLTHAGVAGRSGLARSAVTGILSGSLQKVTIDRVLRLLEAVGLEASVRVRRAA
jgi:predicted XRE-type DNA-binding protein